MKLSSISLIHPKHENEFFLLLFSKGNEGENEDGIDPEIFKEFENKLRLQEALGETPLAKNPFFIRTMADPVFTGNGTEGVEPGKKCILNQTDSGDGYAVTILYILTNFYYGFSF